MSRFVVIGQACHDLSEGSPTIYGPGRLGGAVSFASVVASKLGVSTCAITSIPQEHEQWQTLQERGTEYGFQTMNVNQGHRGGDHLPTTFVNEYDSQGHRIQHNPTQSQRFTLRNASAILSKIDQETSVLVGTVTEDEISLDLLRAIRNEAKSVGITLQGLLRQVHPDTKRVTEHPLVNWKELAMSVDYISLSLEDLRFDGGLDFLEDLKAVCPHITVTDGANGAMIYDHKEGAIHVPAFHMSPEETPKEACWTGAGDTWTTSYMVMKDRGMSISQAASLANLYTALKISKIDHETGRPTRIDGISSIPSAHEIESFVRSNPDRVDEFMVQNGLVETDLRSLFELDQQRAIEGNTNHPEFQ